jgi:hypothetical protein
MARTAASSSVKVVVSSGTTSAANGEERTKATSTDRWVRKSVSLSSAIDSSGDFSAVAQNA